MKCPNCLAHDEFRQIGNSIPWYLMPLRLVLTGVRCECCLMRFYRVRLLGWVF
jgi:hypothetical protein